MYGKPCNTGDRAMRGEDQAYATCAICGGRLLLERGGSCRLAPEAGPPYAAPAPAHTCRPYTPASARWASPRKLRESTRTPDPWRTGAYTALPPPAAALAWLAETFGP